MFYVWVICVLFYTYIHSSVAYSPFTALCVWLSLECSPHSCIHSFIRSLYLGWVSLVWLFVCRSIVIVVPFIYGSVFVSSNRNLPPQCLELFKWRQHAENHYIYIHHISKRRQCVCNDFFRCFGFHILNVPLLLWLLMYFFRCCAHRHFLHLTFCYIHHYSLRASKSRDRENFIFCA